MNRNKWNSMAVEVTLLMMALVTLLMIAFIGWQAYWTFQEPPKTYLGTEVQTTDEYEILFNDSFSGRVIEGERFMDFAVTIRNSTGIERRIATRWIEMKDRR